VAHATLDATMVAITARLAIEEMQSRKQHSQSTRDELDAVVQIEALAIAAKYGSPPNSVTLTEKEFSLIGGQWDRAIRGGV
jgi:hypothetical protein